MKRLALAWGLASTLLAGPAAAFCRATTCNPADPTMHCQRDAKQCLTTGFPLFWPTSCVQISVQTDGSARRNISAAQTEASVQRAIEAWLSIDCGGTSPSIRAELGAQVSCAKSEHNQMGRNANIVMYRDEKWPYPGSIDAYGFTRLHFNPDTGELRDADIEINSADAPLSTGDPVEGADLDSIITHEVGHLFGLDHTLDVDATMFASYADGDDSLRTLEADDAEGMCVIYGSERATTSDSCEPRHGFSELCGADQTEPPLSDTDPGSPGSKGCRFSPGHGAERAPLLLLGVLWFGRRARTKRAKRR